MYASGASFSFSLALLGYSAYAYSLYEYVNKPGDIYHSTILYFFIRSAVSHSTNHRLSISVQNTDLHPPYTRSTAPLF